MANLIEAIQRGCNAGGKNILKNFDVNIEKAQPHKYFKREGTPGHYKYYYTEADYKAGRGSASPSGSEVSFNRLSTTARMELYEKEGLNPKKVTSNTTYSEFMKELFGKKESSKAGFDWNSADAKILAEKGITKDNLKVEVHLYLQGTKITSLPDNLKVEGGVYLADSKITSLPDNLKVGGDLDLEGTNITSLPPDLKVGGSLDLRGTKITQKDFKDTMEIKGKIFLDKEKNTSKFNFA